MHDLIPSNTEIGNKTVWQALSEPEAWMACYTAAMYIGGFPAPLMVFKLSYFSNVHMCFGGANSFMKMYREMIPVFDKVGWRDLVIGATTYIHRMDSATVYAHCLELVLARITIGQNERAFLDHLQQVLQLDKMMCHKLYETTVIRQLKDRKKDFDV